jgi:hypothetical protein
LLIKWTDSWLSRGGNFRSKQTGKSGETTATMSRSGLESAKAEILARAGTTSCLEVTEPGDTGIDDAYNEGIIVDATLEEVEAALAAAAATPGFEDDIAAKRLAHRGSYRYFGKLSGNGKSNAR